MSEPPVLRLNPALDPADIAQALAREGWVRVQAALEAPVADRLAGLLEETIDWADCATAAPSETADYLAYPMLTALAEGRDPGHPIHTVTAFLGAGLLEFARAATGQALTLRTAEARLYGPGHFQGLTQDTGLGFSLDLTRWWRPDWGGQLLFHDAAGDIARGLAPDLGGLILFDAARPHSIAPVAPASPRPRLAIEGRLG
ncbi:2OG-Fe(II) oxygenase family protein [Caulobacter sp.]|uniref:2OG-Fe(II) oxygenase family protein n=1 Tax=Caulobacter sp. TaxID=78 RepID=UPI003BABE0C8